MGTERGSGDVISVTMVCTVQLWRYCRHGGYKLAIDCRHVKPSRELFRVTRWQLPAAERHFSPRWPCWAFWARRQVSETAGMIGTRGLSAGVHYIARCIVIEGRTT